MTPRNLQSSIVSLPLLLLAMTSLLLPTIEATDYDGKPLLLVDVAGKMEIRLKEGLDEPTIKGMVGLLYDAVIAYRKAAKARWTAMYDGWTEEEREQWEKAKKEG